MAAGLLAQAVHPVAKGVAVDAELVGGVAPAAAGVEQGGEGLDQPGVRRGRAEHAVDEGLERRVGKAEQKLEGAEVLVGGDLAGPGVERRARLEEAPAEATPLGRAAHADPRHRLRLDDAAGEAHDVLLAVGADEEGRAVAARGGEIRHAPALELLGDLVAQALAGETVARDGEERRVLAVGLEPEGRHPARRLAVVEPVVLEVLEEVAGQAQLGRAHRAPARELEGERRLPVVEDEAVVLAEVAALAGCLEGDHLAGRDDRQLEGVLEAEPVPRVALGDDAAVLVDEREAAAEVVADDGEECLQSAALEDRCGQPLVHLERARHLLELFAREMRHRRLRDGDERDLVRNREDWERELVRLLDDRRRHVGEAEAHAEAEPGEPVLGKPLDVGALRRRHLAHPEPGREEELAAFEELGRVGELGDVQPADLVPEPFRARGDGQAELGELRDLLNRQHAVCFDARAKTVRRSAHWSNQERASLGRAGQRRGPAAGTGRPGMS